MSDLRSSIKYSSSDDTELVDNRTKATGFSVMCIAVISTAHPEYSLILVDNRDVGPEDPHGRSLSLTDLIGISKPTHC